MAGRANKSSILSQNIRRGDCYTALAIAIPNDIVTGPSRALHTADHFATILTAVTELINSEFILFNSKQLLTGLSSPRSSDVKAMNPSVLVFAGLVVWVCSGVPVCPLPA